MNGRKLLAFRTHEDVEQLSRDPVLQTLLLKRIHDLRKVSRHIKRQQRQLQQMLTQGLNDLRLSNQNARAAAAAKAAEEAKRSAATGGAAGTTEGAVAEGAATAATAAGQVGGAG